MSYKLYKGVDQDLEFKGLKAQYLFYMGGVLLVGLLLVALLYGLGFPWFFALGIPVWLVIYASRRISGLNQRYGKDGLMKKMAFRRLPLAIKIRNRGFVGVLKHMIE